MNQIGDAKALPAEEPGAPEPSPSPRASRKRTATPASPLTINVMIPRGLGRRVDKTLIQRVSRLALERDRWEEPATVDIHIVDDEEMREINASRRGVDEATDVLSFPLFDLEPGAGIRQDFFVLPPEEQVHIGEVLISFPRVEAQAEEAGHSPEREIAFLTVHGVLHLLGYDHETVPDRRRMRRREEEVLTEVGLRRDGARRSGGRKA